MKITMRIHQSHVIGLNEHVQNDKQNNVIDCTCVL